MSAFILLIICTAFNIFGLRESSWVNMVFTCVEVAGLLLVIAARLTRGDFTESLLTQPQPGILPAAAILLLSI
jgi:basic amino acid/polyamine antiporter, APA family